MWCIEAKAKIDIPLGSTYSNFNNEKFLRWFLGMRGKCDEFDKAIAWLGDRGYKEAIRDCNNMVWLNWLKINYPKDESYIIKAGETITVTKGNKYPFALWCGHGIYDLPEDYVGETIKIISNN